MPNPSFDFLEEFQIDGKWSLPNEEAPEVSGRLSFEPGEPACLEVQGLLANEGNPFDLLSKRDIESHPVVHGLSSDGGLYTLLEVHRTGARISTLLTSTYSPTFILRGVHLDPGLELMCDSLWVELDSLQEWLQLTGIKKSIAFSEDGQKVKGLTFNYDPPPLLTFKLDSATLTFTTAYEANAFDQFKIELYERVAAKFTPDSPAPLRQLIRRFIGPMRNLLALSIGSPIRIRRMGLSSRQYPSELAKETKFAGYLQPIDLVYSLRQAPFRRPQAYVNSFVNWLFSDMKGIEQEFFLNWFTLSDTLTPVMENFFGAIHSDRLSLQRLFRDYASSFESFHRRARRNKVMEDEDYNAKIKGILSAVPLEHIEWVSGRFVYGNEPAQKTRYLELLGEVCQTFEMTPEEMKPLARLITDTRNFHTHNDPALRRKAAADERLHELSLLLYWSILNLLLAEVTQERELVCRVIQSNNQFQFFKHNQLPDLCMFAKNPKKHRAID